MNVDLSIDTKKLITRTGLAENDFFEEEALIIPIADSKKELILSTLTDKAVEGSIREKERAPVSYTHLDVYKRQIKCLFILLFTNVNL